MSSEWWDPSGWQLHTRAELNILPHILPNLINFAWWILQMIFMLFNYNQFQEPSSLLSRHISMKDTFWIGNLPWTNFVLHPFLAHWWNNFKMAEQRKITANNVTLPPGKSKVRAMQPPKYYGRRNKKSVHSVYFVPIFGSGHNNIDHNNWLLCIIILSIIMIYVFVTLLLLTLTLH